jgi:Ca-activated chloride channel family protein
MDDVYRLLNPYVPARYNPIIEREDGNYFRATSNSKLKEVYEEIDKLEKTKLNVKEYSKRDEEYHWFALAAFLCVLLEVLLRNSVLKKIP